MLVLSTVPHAPFTGTGLTSTTDVHVAVYAPLNAFTTVMLQVYVHTHVYVCVSVDNGLLFVVPSSQSNNVTLNHHTAVYVHVTLNDTNHVHGLMLKLKSPHCGVSS